ncbi:hypothetical protein E2C01_100404 [Portunus trituberculatus]|uniref:Uncharacterized protein n=1 Tax=Portunus trituberculatus TaxID=210409 RepID=A0A5B7K6V6_PORTR|nr:hypothetical protein [Portunus trituberculatus]
MKWCAESECEAASGGDAECWRVKHLCWSSTCSDTPTTTSALERVMWRTVPAGGCLCPAVNVSLRREGRMLEGGRGGREAGREDGAPVKAERVTQRRSAWGRGSSRPRTSLSRLLALAREGSTGGRLLSTRSLPSHPAHPTPLASRAWAARWWVAVVAWDSRCYVHYEYIKH